MDRKDRAGKEGGHENEGGSETEGAQKREGVRGHLHASSRLQTDSASRPESNQEAMQEKVILYQILQKHMESLGQNASLLERRYEELEMTRQAVEDIARLGKENNILIPIGSGFFARGKISDPEKMLADIGAGIFMDRDSRSSKSLLEEKRQEIERLANELQHEMNEASSRINALAMELEGMSQEQEQKEKKHKQNS